MKTKISGILLLSIVLLSGCIKETLDKCPERNVRVKVYAEKFQTNTPEARIDYEEAFNKRIQFLHCILFKGNTYVMDTTIADVSSTKGPFFEFNIPSPDLGNYHLVIVGNCSPEAMNGDFRVRDGMSLLYLGVDQTEDLFAGILDFTVDCDCTLEFETKLRRLLGVIRCRITNVPENITEAEIILHGVNSSLGKGGIYSKNIDISKRVAAEPSVRSAGVHIPDIVIGAFPTLPDKPASFELKLYSAGSSTPVFEQTLSTQVNVVRNQLVELAADFSDGTVNFEIKIDSKWEDYVNGGETEIQ